MGKIIIKGYISTKLTMSR